MNMLKMVYSECVVMHSPSPVHTRLHVTWKRIKLCQLQKQKFNILLLRMVSAHFWSCAGKNQTINNRRSQQKCVTTKWLQHLSYRGHSSLGVMLPDRTSSGIKAGSPGFLLRLSAFSLTCCSISRLLTILGGIGFTGSSPRSQSSTESFSSWRSFFFFFFLDFCI